MVPWLAIVLQIKCYARKCVCMLYLFIQLPPQFTTKCLAHWRDQVIFSASCQVDPGLRLIFPAQFWTGWGNLEIQFENFTIPIVWSNWYNNARTAIIRFHRIAAPFLFLGFVFLPFASTTLIFFPFCKQGNRNLLLAGAAFLLGGLFAWKLSYKIWNWSSLKNPKALWNVACLMITTPQNRTHLEINLS